MPKTDRDGNDIAGVRLPDVTVPLATYTGWALRRGAWANDGCEAAGQYIPFPKTKADPQASDDPRRSIEERYPSFDKYYNQVRRAVDNMVKDRLLLCEDADDQIERLVNAGLAAGVPTPTSAMPPLESELKGLRLGKPMSLPAHRRGTPRGGGHPWAGKGIADLWKSIFRACNYVKL